MRTLFVVALAVLAVSVVSAANDQEKAHRALEQKLHETMLSKSADYPKLPPLSQKQVVLALREILVRRALVFKPGMKQLNLNSTFAGLPCWICKGAVGWLIDHANDWACDVGFDAIATLACQAAGLGPEDPWSDICTAAIIAGCNIILEHIEDGVTSKTAICQAIDLC